MGARRKRKSPGGMEAGRTGAVKGNTYKNASAATDGCVLQESLLLLKLILADSADWADPILRNIRKSGAGRDAAVRVAVCRIIDVPAD